MADQKLSSSVRVRVRRQDAFDRRDTRRWEEFDVERRTGMTVLSVLRTLQRTARTVAGKSVAPVVWESPCVEQACGVCTMLVNGIAAPACTSRLDDVAPKGKLELAPLSKFAVVRDLWVDRHRMGDDLRRSRAFLHFGGAGEALRESPAAQAERLVLASCTSCGACLEACPEYHFTRSWIGAATVAQVHLANLHPDGSLHRRERTESLMGEGGIADCGKAQNCVEACPQRLPLTESLGVAARDTSKHLLFGWLLGGRR